MISCHFCEVEIQMHATLKPHEIVLLPKRLLCSVTAILYYLPRYIAFSPKAILLSVPSTL